MSDREDSDLIDVALLVVMFVGIAGLAVYGLVRLVGVVL